MDIANINEQIKAAIKAHQATDMRLATLAMLALATMARDKWPTASYIVLTPTDQDDSGELWVQGVFDTDGNVLGDSERFDGWRTPVAYHLHEANEVVWQAYVTAPESAPSYGEYHLDIGKVLAEVDEPNSRPLFLRALGEDDCDDGDSEHRYTVTIDSPDGEPVLGIIVRSDTVRVIAWPDGEIAMPMGEVRLPGCTECQTGYVLDQTYGHAEIPDGWTPVQRHDQCNRFESDAEAAAYAAHDKGLVAAEYFYAEQDPENPDEYIPGDYAIHWTEKGTH